MKGSGDMPQPDDQTRKRPKQRRSISSLTSKKLYQEADNRCPFRGVADVAVLEKKDFVKRYEAHWADCAWQPE